MNKYNVPEDIDELFENGEETYTIVDYNIESMDNIQSMSFFLELLNIPDDNIYLYDGTMVILKHNNYDYKLRIDSGGLGDFYSHKFDITIEYD